MHLKLNPYKDLEEISLRDELVDFITGKDFGVDKMTPYILRSLRKDGLGKPVYCGCFNKQSGEGSIACPYCDGVGTLWDESIIPGYLYYLTKKLVVQGLNYTVEAGRGDIYESAFVTLSDTSIEQGDYIMMPALTEDGYFINPLRMEEKYMVIRGKGYRFDEGRSEYTAAVVKKVG